MPTDKTTSNYGTGRVCDPARGIIKMGSEAISTVQGQHRYKTDRSSRHVENIFQDKSDTTTNRETNGTNANGLNFYPPTPVMGRGEIGRKLWKSVRSGDRWVVVPVSRKKGLSLSERGNHLEVSTAERLTVSTAREFDDQSTETESIVGMS